MGPQKPYEDWAKENAWGQMAGSCAKCYLIGSIGSPRYGCWDSYRTDGLAKKAK